MEEEVISCPNCKTENRKSAKFCKNCSYSMGEAVSLEKTPVRFCEKCKTPNRSSAKFCSLCGHSFIELTITGPLSAGTILVNRYEIISLIKTGGMGSVYRARDHRMLEICAIKELIGDTEKPEQKEYCIKRFNEEGKILSKLSHPSLPSVTDLFIERGRYYLVMDFIEGEDLASYLKNNKLLSQKDTIKYTMEIIDVLNYLHSQSPPVIYRDIKPGNIMIRLRDQRAMLIDFGIARTIQADDDKRTKIGTPQYSPMEQFKGNVEPRSDIYSIGATMHHLLTGIRPTPMAFQFDPVTKINPDLDKMLEAIIIKATQGDVKDRYNNAKEMMEQLKIAADRVEKGINTPIVLESKPLKTEKVVIEEDIQEKVEEEIKIEIPEIQVQPEEKSIFDIAKEAKKARKLKKDKKEKAVSITVRKSTTPMVLVPAGYFWMGGSECEYDPAKKDKCETNRKDQHRVYLKDFYIDITPVTNEQYKIFVEEKGYKSEGNWEKNFKPGKEDHPVVNITWFDASRYAEWAGKRLPTEAEWEKAARSSDGRLWPWGNIWDENKLNSKEKGPQKTTPVKQYPRGESPYGVMDTAGNVWEWTSDWYVPYPYEGPYLGKEGDKKTARGGSYKEGKDKCNCYSRTWGFPENKSSFRGFRCARDGEASE